MSKLRKLFKSEQGISLIEVVASIVIIGIILISFFSLLIQSNKTGKASEKIVDSTYVAQQEMEKMHGLSKSMIMSMIKSDLGTEYKLNVDDSSEDLMLINDSLIFEQSNPSYSLKIKFKKLDDSNLIGVIVEVYDSTSTTLKSKMENIFIWKVA